MIASSYGRVPAHTSAALNERIRQCSRESLERALAGGPEQISRRFHELDREWDVERVIETDAALAILGGLALGLALDRRFLLLSLVGAGGLVLHATTGWSPFLNVVRRFGYRTAAEISAERYALKAGRGDFRRLEIPLDPAEPRPDPALVFEAARSTT